MIIVVKAQNLPGNVSKKGQITLNHEPTSGTGLVYSVTFNWFYYDGTTPDAKNSSPDQKSVAGIQFVIQSVSVKDYAYVDGTRYSSNDVTLVNNQYPKHYLWEAHIARSKFGIKTHYGDRCTHGTLNRSYQFAYQPDFDGFWFTTGNTTISTALPFPGLGNPQICTSNEGEYELRNALRLKGQGQNTSNSPSVNNPAKASQSSSYVNNTENKSKSAEYTNKGNQFYANGNYDEAEMYWQKAVELDPNNNAARNNLDNLKKIQNSNAKIMAQSQQRADNFNTQQANIQQSSEQIANNIVDGSPNAVGQAGVSTAKLLAESGASATESMLGGAGVVALGALLNGNGKEKNFEKINVYRAYPNGIYKGNLYKDRFSKGKVYFINGLQVEILNSNGYVGEANYIWPNYYNSEGTFHLPHEINANLNRHHQITVGLRHKNHNTNIYFANGDSLLANNTWYGFKYISNKNYYIDCKKATLDKQLGAITDQFHNKHDGNFIKQWRRDGKNTFQWNSTQTIINAEYKNCRRDGKLLIEFKDGASFKGKYKDGLLTNPTYKASSGQKYQFDIQSLESQGFDPHQLDQISRVLILMYEDFLNNNMLKEAHKSLELARKISSTQIAEEYSNKNLRFVLLDRYPIEAVDPIAYSHELIISDLLPWIHDENSFNNENPSILGSNYAQVWRLIFLASRYINYVTNQNPGGLTDTFNILKEFSVLTNDNYFQLLNDLDQSFNSPSLPKPTITRKINLILKELDTYSKDYRDSWYWSRELHPKLWILSDQQYQNKIIELQRLL